MTGLMKWIVCGAIVLSAVSAGYDVKAQEGHRLTTTRRPSGNRWVGAAAAGIGLPRFIRGKIASFIWPATFWAFTNRSIAGAIGVLSIMA